jgi:predicted phosphodiesterase
MRLAFISDLHGNEQALRAVLKDIAAGGVDQVICLGDVATLGPRPEAVLEQLEASRTLTLMGNHDDFMLDASLVAAYSKIPVLIDAIDWCRDRLSSDGLAFIRSFQRTFELTLENGERLLAYHGTPDSNVTDLLATTPPDEVDAMLDGQRASIMLGGHTHIQMLRQHRGFLLVNPGSLGMPFKEYVGGGPPEVLPHAEYALVESTKTSSNVRLHRVALDKHELRKSAQSVDNPLSPSLAAMYS